jgi:hypothetical protein
MPLERKVISTTMGNSLIPLGSDVYVQLLQNRFVKKKAEDVNVGDLILFRKQYVTTSLEDIDHVLDRSPRYRNAKTVLHEMNSRGEFIPKFRTLLIRGLAQRGTIQDENLEARIQNEMDDFSSPQYNAMVQEVFSTVNPDYKEDDASTRVRTRAAVYQWLKGGVVGIQMGDWDIYRRLEQIHHGFTEFDASDKSKTGLFYNYRLYVLTRKVIKKYLSACKGEGRGPGDEQESPHEHIDLTDEIQLVVSHFMQDIDEQYAAARVLNTHTVVPDEESHQQKKPDPFLSKGIVTREADPRRIEEVDMVTLADEYRPLHYNLQMILENYLAENLQTDPALSKDFCTISANIALAVYSIFDQKGKVIVSPDHPVDVCINKALYNENESKRILQLMEKVLPWLEHAITIGEVDKFYRWGDGKFLKLLETTHKLRNALPKEYVLYYDLFNPMNIRRVSDGRLGWNFADSLRQIMNPKTTAKLRGYGFVCDEKRPFIGTRTRAQDELSFDPSIGPLLAEKVRQFIQRTDTMYGSVIDLFGGKDAYLQFLREFKEKGITLWTHKRIRIIFEKYGLGEVKDRLELLLPPDERRNNSLEDEYNLILEEENKSAKCIPSKALDERIRQIQTQRKKQDHHVHTRDETIRHRKITEYLSHHPEAIERGLEFIDAEYVFPTHDRIDLVFKDHKGRYLVVEAEHIASGEGGRAGFLQAVKYESMFIADNNLPNKQVRGMLVALEISDKIKGDCQANGIECKEVSIPYEELTVQNNKAHTLTDGTKISLEGFQPKEQEIYRKLIEFHEKKPHRNAFPGIYAQIVQEVYGLSSKTKTQRKMEELTGTPLSKIYQDLESKL